MAAVLPLLVPLPLLQPLPLPRPLEPLPPRPEAPEVETFAGRTVGRDAGEDTLQVLESIMRLCSEASLHADAPLLEFHGCAPPHRE